MTPAHRGSIAVLLLRLISGVAFMLHGWPKITNPFHWLDMAPNPPPGFLQLFAAVAEFVGGFGLLVGLLTPLSAFGIACTMAFAAFTHVSRGDPFLGKGGPSYELALLYFVIMLSLIFTGPGRYSVDQHLLGGGKPNDYDY